MFDYIKCSYALPLSEEAAQKIGPQDWEDISFQTKSFSNHLMDVYSIEEDGQIYKEEVEREVVGCGETCEIKERSLGIEKVDWTGELIFYYDFFENDYDYWIEFKALIWRGDLKEIEMLHFKQMENGDRKKMEEEMTGKMLTRINKEKKWWWRYFLAWCWVIRFPLGFIRWSVGLVARCTWRLERWLTGGVIRF